MIQQDIRSYKFKYTDLDTDIHVDIGIHGTGCRCMQTYLQIHNDTSAWIQITLINVIVGKVQADQVFLVNVIL
jgi:hypothetical protein